MSEKENLVNQLSEIVGAEHVVPALAGYEVEGFLPPLTVFPGCVEEVSDVVKVLARAGLTIIPRGRGTKMNLGALPRRADVLLSLSRLKDIVEHDADNLTVTAQAGLTLAELQKELAGAGQFLPLDPPQANRATLGGLVAANVSGPRRLLYGSLRDLVLGMKVVLADGEVIRSGGKTVKNVSGYDMTKLFIGSLGTLGILVEITFRLLPLPARMATLVVHFPSLSQGTKAVAHILDSELLPSALELFNSGAASLTSLQAEAGEFTLVVGVEGSPETVSRHAAQMEDFFHKAACKVELIEGMEAQNALWEAISNLIPEALAQMPGSVALRAGLPLSQVEAYLGEAEEIARLEGLSPLFQARAGSGLVYTALPPRLPQEDRLAEMCASLEELAVRLGGYQVVEAAPMRLKERLSVWGRPTEGWPLMRALKESLDQQGLLNPGRFI